jgi:hypothetical protein
MIFIDSSEHRSTSNFPKLSIEHAWVDSLESLTGADALVTIENEPTPSTERRVKFHLEQGAYLIQFKLGLDIASSVGQRLHRSLYQMREIGAKNPQCVLAYVGIITSKDDGTVLINNRRVYPPKMQYDSLMTALYRWCDRGGVLNPIRRIELIENYLEGKLRDIPVYQQMPVKESYPVKIDYPDDPGDVMQVIVPVTDWRITLAAMPGVGLGPKKLNRLQDDILKAKEPDTLFNALRRLVDSDAPKTRGIGKGIKGKVRTHLGLQEGQNLVVTPHFPTTLIFPANAKMAVVNRQWERLPDGKVKATYNNREELALCIASVGEHRDEVWEAMGIGLDKNK